MNRIHLTAQQHRVVLVRTIVGLLALLLPLPLIAGTLRDPYLVVWNTPGHDDRDSMPIGNGDFAANVWTESNGDIVLPADFRTPSAGAQ